MVTIIEPEVALTEKKLASVEKRLGIRLPKEYRAFLLRTNGGHPDPSFFGYVTGRYNDSSVHYFLSIYNGPYSNFEKSFNTFNMEQKRMPDRLVPIAHDEGGNQICISVGKKDYGAIYFWDHEDEGDDDEDDEDDEEPSEANVHLIAPSFNKFLDVLRPDVKQAQKAWKEMMTSEKGRKVR